MFFFGFSVLSGLGKANERKPLGFWFRVLSVYVFLFLKGCECVRVCGVAGGARGLRDHKY